MRRPCRSTGCNRVVSEPAIWCSACAPEAEAREAARQASKQRRAKAARAEQYAERVAVDPDAGAYPAPSYQARAWRRKSADQRRRDPWCAFCLARGRYVSADVSDHVVPHRGDPALFWDGALQSLCFPCHAGEKQRREREHERGGVVDLGASAEWKDHASLKFSGARAGFGGVDE